MHDYVHVFWLDKNFNNFSNRLHITWYVPDLASHSFISRLYLDIKIVKILDNCNSMPFGAAWAYYGKVLILANAALLNSRVRGEVK